MIAILDYGMGNLRSVEKALALMGAQTVITDSPDRVAEASHVILPGVGAFGDAMVQLKKTGLNLAFCQAVAQGKPALGICLGMQLLFDASEEGGYQAGLGLLPGVVTRFPQQGIKVPHMGWNTLSLRPCPLLAGIEENAAVYFVHSYRMAEVSPEWTVATAVHGAPFTAAIQRGNLFGTQFHPEKSGEIGLAMLRNFVQWKGACVPC